MYAHPHARHPRPRSGAFAVAAVLLVAAGTARAAGNQIEVLDYGVYALNVTRTVPAPKDVSKSRNIVANVRVLRKSRVIAAQPERSFGYQFRVVDPALFGRRLILRTIFPPITNPETGETATTQDRPFVPVPGQIVYDGYRFDHRWEMAEGIWRFQIIADGKVLSDQKFKIVIPLN